MFSCILCCLISQLVGEQRVPPQFIPHDQLSEDEVQACLVQGESIGSNWQKLLFNVSEHFLTKGAEIKMFSNPNGSFFNIQQHVTVYISNICRCKLWSSNQIVY